MIDCHRLIRPGCKRNHKHKNQSYANVNVLFPLTQILVLPRMLISLVKTRLTYFIFQYIIHISYFKCVSFVRALYSVYKNH